MAEQEQIKVEPFASWVEERLLRYQAEYENPYEGTNVAPVQRLATELGMPAEYGVRQINRWVRRVKNGSRNGVKGDYPTDTFVRSGVEAALEAAGWSVYDLYPNLRDEDGEGVERFCGNCHEAVTTSDDLLCPWCEHATEDIGGRRGKRYCKACDLMVWATGEGTCWRCTGPLGPMPWDRCACGCRGRVHRFDKHGRRIKFLHGHAPRKSEKDELWPTPQFAQWLRDEVRNLDPIAAISSRIDLTRAEVIGVLEGDITEFSRERMRRALWRAAAAGGSTGSTFSTVVPSLYELYPERQPLKCPGCGGGKARHAELCKQCRKRADRKNGTNRFATSTTKLRPEQIAEATRRAANGEAVFNIAASMIRQTPYSSIESLAHAISYRIKQEEAAA